MWKDSEVVFIGCIVWGHLIPHWKDKPPTSLINIINDVAIATFTFHPCICMSLLILISLEYYVVYSIAGAVASGQSGPAGLNTWASTPDPDPDLMHLPQ